MNNLKLFKTPDMRMSYGHHSAYRGEGLSEELRRDYHAFNYAKSAANGWLRNKNVPLMLRFKPVSGKSMKPSIWSNMELHVSYIMPNRKLIHVSKHRLSYNQIRLDAHKSTLIKFAIESLLNCSYVDDILSRAEAGAAYEMAY